MKTLLKLFAVLAAVTLVSCVQAKEIKFLNVSYDPTRELYEDYNKVFIKYWEGKAGQKLTIR